MRKAFVYAVGFALSISILPSISLADDIPPEGSIPLSKVVNNIYTAGYGNISKIEYDDGTYKAEVINEGGQQQYLYIDPKTGFVPVKDKGSKVINISEAIKAIPENTCETIYEVENKNGYYKIGCLGKNNKEIKIKIDSKTGKLLQIKQDND